MGSYSVRTSRNFEKGGIFLIILGGHNTIKNSVIVF